MDLNIPGESATYAIHKHGNKIEFDETSPANPKKEIAK